MGRKNKILHWLFERLFRILHFNPCEGCAYNMDEDEASPYNWGDGQPIETSTNNIYYKGERKW